MKCVSPKRWPLRCVAASLLITACSSPSGASTGGKTTADAASGQPDAAHRLDDASSSASASPTTTTGAGAGSDAAAPPNTPDADAGTGAGDNGGTGVGRDGGAMACRAVPVDAAQPVTNADVIWIIDGSGSMIDEAQRLQQNIDDFNATIAAQGVSTRIVLVSAMDLWPSDNSGNYLFVADQVDSHNALERLLARFPDYASFLRPTSHVHVVIVSDDESNFMSLPSPAQRADAFLASMGELLENDYTIHAIASPGQPSDLPCRPAPVTPEIADCCQQCLLTFCTSPPVGCEQHVDATGAPLINQLGCAYLSGAAAPGTTYFALAGATGGIATSICTDDWSELLASLGSAVVTSSESCRYAIPQPPAGALFDPQRVNVKSAAALLPRVERASDCGVLSAWHFDDSSAPNEIVLCDAACNTVIAEHDGQLEVVFGCAAVLADP